MQMALLMSSFTLMFLLFNTLNGLGRCFLFEISEISKINPSYNVAIRPKFNAFASKANSEHSSKDISPDHFQESLRNQRKEHLSKEIREALAGWPELCRRHWINMGNGSEEDSSEDSSLTVLQWNVLSDGLSGQHPTLGGFIRAPPESLCWDLRRYRILEEIIRWDADILCLQEVDHYFDWFLPNLAPLGYAGIFARKPASPCLQYSDLEDGCAIFYLKDKFDLKSSISSVYNVKDRNGAAVPSNQVYILAELCFKNTEDQPPGKSFIVSSTHLKADKTGQGEKVRAMQAKQLFDEILSMAVCSTTQDIKNSQHKASVNSCNSGHQNKQVIICGDFNATPQGKRNYPALCYPLCISHSMRMVSIFQKQEQILNTQEVYTTWKVRPNLDGTERHVKDCLDYIFLSANIVTNALVSFPTEMDGIDSHYTPSYSYPSDHFALITKLNLDQKD